MGVWQRKGEGEVGKVLDGERMDRKEIKRKVCERLTEASN